MDLRLTGTKEGKAAYGEASGSSIGKRKEKAKRLFVGEGQRCRNGDDPAVNSPITTFRCRRAWSQLVNGEGGPSDLTSKNRAYHDHGARGDWTCLRCLVISLVEDVPGTFEVQSGCFTMGGRDQAR